MSLVTVLILTGIGVILSCIAGVSNSIMDTLNFKYKDSIFSKIPETSKWYWWLNTPNITWKNKYKNRDPEQGPAFPGSTTWLVWVTDAWHFFQMIMFSCLQLMITLPIVTLYSIVFPVETWEFIVMTIVLFITFKVTLSSTFELFWSRIWKK
jgi:hypothetical protein